MKLLSVCKDGGLYSTVWGLFLLEIKFLFSVILLCFEDGSREAYHSHAFDCISWVLCGQLEEHHLDGEIDIHPAGFRPVLTRRDTFHKVYSRGRTWVITFRGPWAKQWKEYLPKEQKFVTLEHGRKIAA